MLTGVAGTNTITATGPANYAYAAARTPLYFVPAATNTGATTINVTPSGGAALGARNIFFNGVACVGGELRINVPTALIDDGTRFQIVGFSARRIVLATEVATTSGTSIDFTSIPAGVRRIKIQFVGVSTNGTSNPLIQLGDSGGVETTGYLGSSSLIDTAVATAGYTAGFGLNIATADAVIHGTVTLTLEDSSDFTWVASGVVSTSDTARSVITSGRKLLSAELDRVRITTVNGTDAFDAGAINISYEF